MKKKALYAGSFDPLTLGHLDIIERAAKIFDELTVGVVVNLEKKTLFTFEERMDMIRKVTAHLPNVKVDACEGLLADFVNQNDFQVVVRGLRGVGDFDSEQQMAHLHRHLYQENVETVFLISDAKIRFYKFNHGEAGDLSGWRWPDACASVCFRDDERKNEIEMEDTMKVLELLEELEDIVDNATNVPLTSKIMLEAEDVFNIVREVRLALPDDVQQAKWIRDERDRILADAKTEYERIIREAKKQADYLVETDDITLRATKLAQEIREDAELHAKMLKMRTYDYVDKMLYDMQAKMDELNLKYFGEMYTNLDKTFAAINQTLVDNRDEIKQLAYHTQNDLDVEE